MFSLRTKLEGLFIILLGISIFLAHSYYNKYLEQKNEKENIELLFSKKEAEIELYKNKHGQLVAKNEAVSLENKSIKELVKDGNLQFLKQFDNLKRNYKNLENAYEIQAKISDSLKSKLNFIDTSYVTSKGDTVKFKAFSWGIKDKWREISLKQITPDSVYFKEEQNVPLDGVLYWKRKWFLGKKHYFSEVTSENPHVRINKLLTIRIEGKRK